MLGLIRGRVYYNLLNWYRLLALLPGFEANRALHGADDGRQGAAARFDRRRAGARRPGRPGMQDAFACVGSIFALVATSLRRLPRRSASFYAGSNDALGTGRPDLDGDAPMSWSADYRDLERQLLTRWDAPLVNDFFAMIFYGLLGKLTREVVRRREAPCKTTCSAARAA